MTNLLERLQQQLGESLASGVEVGLGSIGTGLFTADGRQVGAAVRETATASVLDLSDGGETWSDLWMDGYVPRSPTPALRAKLEALCQMYGVIWDQKARAIVCVSSPSGFADAARRIAAASIAIDGWRLWLLEREERVERASVVVEGVRSIAERRHWIFEEKPSIKGRRFSEWRANALFTRSERQAALTFLDDATPDKAMQRIAGWVLDTNVPLVFVAQERIANDINALTSFPQRAIIIPRHGLGLPEAIMGAIEAIAA